MPGYGAGFARVYNTRWAGLAKQVAPYILDFYTTTPLATTNEVILDLCCGTGQWAAQALQKGYRVVGIDASPDMLAFARQNTNQYIDIGKATFFEGDARNFTLEYPVGLAVSTYDSLNHLDSEQDLGSCFRSVLAAVADGGYFIFDLNTRKKLRNWTGIEVTDTEDFALIQRAMFVEGQNKAFLRITGFSRTTDGLYERFEETLSNTAFAVETVKNLLDDSGWRQVHCARIQDLGTALTNPEEENRVFFVAKK